MARNILDSFKVVNLHLNRGLRQWSGITQEIIFLPNIEIIQFDLIGILIDFEGTPLFIPHANITLLEPVSIEPTATAPNWKGAEYE